MLLECMVMEKFPDIASTESISGDYIRGYLEKMWIYILMVPWKWISSIHTLGIIPVVGCILDDHW